ncbi:hypothetical protein BC827DRAFT_1157419 [Russula dissimulans]|nr:hypothetical protein BC827DRAFT_1157419 [Russula dissimulans]
MMQYHGALSGPSHDIVHDEDTPARTTRTISKSALTPAYTNDVMLEVQPLRGLTTNTRPRSRASGPRSYASGSSRALALRGAVGPTSAPPTCGDDVEVRIGEPDGADALEEPPEGHSIIADIHGRIGGMLEPESPGFKNTSDFLFAADGGASGVAVLDVQQAELAVQVPHIGVAHQVVTDGAHEGKEMIVGESELPVGVSVGITLERELVGSSLAEQENVSSRPTGVVNVVDVSVLQGHQRRLRLSVGDDDVAAATEEAAATTTATILEDLGYYEGTLRSPKVDKHMLKGHDLQCPRTPKPLKLLVCLELSPVFLARRRRELNVADRSNGGAGNRDTASASCSGTSKGALQNFAECPQGPPLTCQRQANTAQLKQTTLLVTRNHDAQLGSDVIGISPIPASPPPQHVGFRPHADRQPAYSGSNWIDTDGIRKSDWGNNSALDRDRESTTKGPPSTNACWYPPNRAQKAFSSLQSDSGLTRSPIDLFTNALPLEWDICRRVNVQSVNSHVSQVTFWNEA